MVNHHSPPAFGNGVNLQPSYYGVPRGHVDFAWSLMKQYNKIKTVRIEIEPNRAVEARSWVQQACSRGYAVIATYHKHTVLGSDSTAELQAAAAWWQGNYRNLTSAPITHTVAPGETLGAIALKYYGDASTYNRIFIANRTILPDPHTIRVGQRLVIPAHGRDLTVNLMNEWGSHTLQARDYATAYNAAIGVVRSVYQGPIIIDAPGWAQETAVLASAIKGHGTGGVRISDANVIASIHVYRKAWIRQKTGSGPSGAMVPADLDDLASAGRRCIIGEFGPGDPGAGGSTNWSTVVAHAKSLGWPILGWAWNGDGGTMNMAAPQWTPANATAASYTPSPYFSTIYGRL